MVQEIPQVNPMSGKPGEVKVNHRDDLYKGCVLSITVGEGGEGGMGGFPLTYPTPADIEGAPEEPYRGAAGGGRENDPIVHAFLTYQSACKGTKFEPLAFTIPGQYEEEWPYETPTATMVAIGAGGGGQGGTGWILPGGEGEVGGPGAVFVFPTYLPALQQT